MKKFDNFLSKHSKNLTKTQILSEIFGTMLFTYGYSASEGNPFLITLSLFLPLFIISDFIGVYFNLAITILNIVKKKNKMPLRDGIILILSQIIAGILGGLFCFFFFDKIAIHLFANTNNNQTNLNFFGEILG